MQTNADKNYIFFILPTSFTNWLKVYQSLMVIEVLNKTTGSFSVENVNSPAADAAYQTTSQLAKTNKQC
jgi:hypothetical protein